MLRRLLRPVGRFLLRAIEGAAALFGFIFAFAWAAIGNSLADELALPGFLFGSGLAVAGIVFFRRKTRTWKIRYDATNFERERAERRLHPVRARRKRLARRILIWTPSAIAAFVLFFFPVTTHLIQPFQPRFGNYRVPIPWNLTMFAGQPFGWARVFVNSGDKSQFGVSPFPVPPFWRRHGPISEANFGSNFTARPFDANGKEVQSEGPPLVNEFRLGDVVLTCWQYKPRYHRYYPGVAVVVECDTAAATGDSNFFARFRGYEEDLGAFYQIIENITTRK